MLAQHVSLDATANHSRVQYLTAHKQPAPSQLASTPEVHCPGYTAFPC